MKHTPGPWFYLKGDEWSHSVVTQHGELPDGSQSYWTVASINKQREPEHEANARLISAAPDLLEALDLAFKVLQRLPEDCVMGDHPVWAKTRAAIAKATGENK
jgi:hypothetical protein